jgi:hypothetical protein
MAGDAFRQTLSELGGWKNIVVKFSVGRGQLGQTDVEFVWPDHLLTGRGAKSLLVAIGLLTAQRTATLGITYFVSERVWLEGIVAKRKDSCYEPGKRGGVWLKYKVNKAREVVIGGYYARQSVRRIDEGCGPDG